MTSAADPLVAGWIMQAGTVVGPRMPQVIVEDFDGPANAETKYEAGAIRMKWRRGYPAQLSLSQPNAQDLAQAAIEIEYTACHDLGHGVAYWLRSLGIDVEQELYVFRGYAGTAAAIAAATPNDEAHWANQPREQVAETLRAAIGGRWIKPERAFNEGKFLDPMAARTWLQGLVARATASAPVPVPPPQPAPSRPIATIGAKVLWHLSHHSSSRADGWSGAPDEARWIREDLTPRVVDACRHYGIELVLVDGDGGSADNPMGNHPEFDDDYLAFIAPHYEANLHGHGGWFWGRADGSLSGDRDDILGRIFERRYIDLTFRTGGPSPQFAWTNPNVTDYYGFRLTTSNTPGILVEHGVGWNVPADYDFTWLREHVQDIADVWALTLLEFAGGPLPGKEEDLDRDETIALIEEKYGLTNTVAAVKEALKGQAAAITKLANDETLDDAEVAQLKARIDKLRTI